VSSDVRAHTTVHLKFLARSRVLLGFGLLVTLWAGVMLIPAFVAGSLSDRFESLRAVAETLHFVAAVVTAGLGLFVLSSHRRARTIKIVATKPSAFEGWVASVFAAPVLVGLVAQAVVAGIILGLSLYWGVPYQVGFVYLAARRFIQSAIALAYLTALGSIIHPVLAVVVALVVNEWTFSAVAANAAALADRGWLALRAVDATASALYYIVPTFSPFADQIGALDHSFRVATIDWRYLWASAGYAAVTCAFGYLATLVALRRSPLI
jgi:hypothetical protein